MPWANWCNWTQGWTGRVQKSISTLCILCLSFEQKAPCTAKLSSTATYKKAVQVVHHPGFDIFAQRGKSCLYSWINMLEKLAKLPHFWSHYHFDCIFKGVNIFYFSVYKPESSTSPPPHHHTTPRKKSHHYTWINHKQNHLEEQGKFIFYHLCHLATHSTRFKTFADLTQGSTWTSE